MSNNVKWECHRWDFWYSGDVVIAQALERLLNKGATIIAVTRGYIERHERMGEATIFYLLGSPRA